METYLSIPKDIVDHPIYAFDKLDGSNMRVEWTKKNGFCKWGTKTQMLDKTHPVFGQSIELFLNKYGEDLSRIFVKERYEKSTSFFEYHSPNSFAGTHADEPHFVTLFDIKIHKKGYLLPKDFIKLTDRIEVAQLLYHGNPNQEFLELVRSGKLNGMTFEGVVCKGQKYIYPGTPLMFKVKNRAWIEKLKVKCDGNINLFNQLQ